jgi:hypothetical protein
VANVRERLAVNKQRSRRFQTERLSLKKLNEINDKSSIVLRSQICLQPWKVEEDINNTISEIIKMSAKESVGYYEFKKHKPWFDEGHSKL